MKHTRTPHPPSEACSAAKTGGVWELVRVVWFMLFGDKVAALIAELEALFAAWRAGTLPPIPARPIPTKPATPRPAHTRAPRQRGARTRNTQTASRVFRAARPACRPSSPKPPWQLPPSRVERPPKPQKTGLIRSRGITSY